MTVIDCFNVCVELASRQHVDWHRIIVFVQNLPVIKLYDPVLDHRHPTYIQRTGDTACSNCRRQCLAGHSSIFVSGTKTCEDITRRHQFKLSVFFFNPGLVPVQKQSLIYYLLIMTMSVGERNCMHHQCFQHYNRRDHTAPQLCFTHAELHLPLSQCTAFYKHCIGTSQSDAIVYCPKSLYQSRSDSQCATPGLIACTLVIAEARSS